jgi:hypothetical protein
MNKNRCSLFILTTSTLLLLSLSFLLQPVSAQTTAPTSTPIATYIVNNNSTHFWVNNNLWLSKNATYTLQSAFNNLPTQGGKIFLKAGVYPVNGIYITNKKPLDDSPYQQIILEGEGKQVATLKLNDNAKGASSKIETFPSYADKAVIWCEPYNTETGIRVTISNIGIDGNRKNQQTEIAGIAVYNDWDSSIEDNYLYNSGGHGIISLGSKFLRAAFITGNFVYFTDMHGENPATPKKPLECYLSGIYSCRTDVVIRENIVGWTGYRNESCFLGVGISASFATVENNWVWGNYIGVLIANGQFFSLSNNFIENNVNGVYLWNAHCGTIQNNNIRVSCNPDTGIKIGGNSSYNSIKINKIWVRDNLTAKYGIQESETADYNNIRDNDILAGAKIFVSDKTVNGVGNILTPISTVGDHTVVSGNNDEIETDQSAASLLQPKTPDPQIADILATIPELTSVPTTTNQPVSPIEKTKSLESTDIIPWTFLALLFIAIAGGVLPLLFRKKA